MKTNFASDAKTKQRADKNKPSPNCLIFKVSEGISEVLAQAKQTEAQPAKMANPTLVMEVVSKALLPKVNNIKMPPEMKISSNKRPNISLMTEGMIDFNLLEFNDV